MVNTISSNDILWYIRCRTIFLSKNSIRTVFRVLQMTTNKQDKWSLSGHMTQTTSFLFLTSFLQTYTTRMLLNTIPSIHFHTTETKQKEKLFHKCNDNNISLIEETFLTERPFFLFMGACHGHVSIKAGDLWWSRFLVLKFGVSTLDFKGAHVPLFFHIAELCLTSGLNVMVKNTVAKQHANVSLRRVLEDCRRT